MNDVTQDFNQIYDTYFPAVKRYLTRLVGDSEAEDLTQEVFLKIHFALPAFRGESKLTTWIYRIATNSAWDRLRASSFKRKEQEEPWEEEGTDGPQSYHSVSEGNAAQAPIEQILFDKERADCYQKFIHNLPLNYRTVIALGELEGFVAGEIAAVLGLSVDTVKMRLHRGRARLMQELRTHCKPEDWL